MKLVRIPTAIAAIAIASATVLAQAPQPPPAAGSASVQQQNEEILRELRAIRMLLERVITPSQAQRPAQTGRVTNLKGYALGSANAPLTMVEFTDLQCPYCRQFAITSFDEIKKNWIDTGKLRYISRDFPLEIHAQAMPAARAARCAGEQGKFWEVRLALVRNANQLSTDYIRKTAADLKLDMKAFAACSTTSKYDDEINAELEEGARLGVTGTPTFVMGRTTPTAVEGPILIGALPYARFDATLKELLK